jgi:hypothetical protein
LILPWPRAADRDDPYWDFFIHSPPSDLANSLTDIIRRAPEGAVNPAKADIHTPEITSSHIKELAYFLGADLVGVARLDAPAEDGEAYPFAVMSVVQAEYDPRQAAGIGGQVPVQKALYVTFVLSAYIRELGYRATAAPHPDAERLAARAGLGTLDAAGRLVTPRYGSRVYVGDAIRTDLPLAADG